MVHGDIIELLRAIGLHGSIAGAARVRHMQFRTAWGYIQKLNEAFKEPVVIVVDKPTSGGRSSSLTSYGVALVEEFDNIETAYRIAAKPAMLAIAKMVSSP